MSCRAKATTQVEALAGATIKSLVRLRSESALLFMEVLLSRYDGWKLLDDYQPVALGLSVARSGPAPRAVHTMSGRGEQQIEWKRILRARPEGKSHALLCL